MHDVDDAELGRELAALGQALPEIDLIGAVRADIDVSGRGRPLARVAAVALAVVAAVVAIPDAREAAADWLGIGRTSVTAVDELPSATSTTSLPTPSEGPIDLAAAEAALGFDIVLPSADLVGPTRAIEIGDREAVIVWDDVSLTVRPLSPDTPLFQKFVDEPGDVTRLMLADGADAIWLAADHVILRGDDAETAGSVLLWTVGAAEYRLADAPDLDTAVAIAESLD